MTWRNSRYGSANQVHGDLLMLGAARPPAVRIAAQRADARAESRYDTRFVRRSTKSTSTYSPSRSGVA